MSLLSEATPCASIAKILRQRAKGMKPLPELEKEIKRKRMYKKLAL